MRRYSDRHNLQTLSELNVTPLLDLAFVLLIIFMICTPLMENSVELVVPTSEAAAKAVDPSAVQTISIDRDQQVKWNARVVTLAELATVAGLVVAIPAMFGYNSLLVRSKKITARNQIFADELEKRIAETWQDVPAAQAA